VVTGSSGRTPPKTFTTVGLALDAFLVSGSFPHLSTGLSSNLNPERPFAAVTVSLLIGKMPFYSGPFVVRRRR
jgi:hypothetical protein